MDPLSTVKQNSVFDPRLFHSAFEIRLIRIFIYRSSKLEALPERFLSTLKGIKEIGEGPMISIFFMKLGSKDRIEIVFQGEFKRGDERM